MIWIIFLLFINTILSDTKVPMIVNHNNQIHLQIGDTLRLECPIHLSSFHNLDLSPSSPASSSSSSSLSSLTNSQTNSQLNQPADEHDISSGVIYNWKVKDMHDYALDTNPHFKFSQQRRVLQITQPLQVSDSGNYTCLGVTGFGKREVTFEVHVRDPNANLLCATPIINPNKNDLKAPCFIDPILKLNPAISVERPIGSTVQFNCEAEGTEPIKYRWFMGNSVADWITTGQGVRGPILSIERIGREHTGQYTCQVSNAAGSLNYTYRLLVNEPSSATPKIVSSEKNYTFKSDTNIVPLTAKVKCVCEEPVIQWLKRIEPGEELMYEQSGATKIPLPNARESEQNEIYVILGSWLGSPAVVEKSQLLGADNNNNDQKLFADYNVDPHQILGNEFKDDKSIYYRNKLNNHKIQIDKYFLSKLRLKKPIEKDRHEGKYIVMTMSLTDVKSLEYDVIYVTIIEDSAFLKGRRMLIYFLVPFVILFAIIGLGAYLFVCRRHHHHHPGHSISSSNERCILRSAELTPQSYQIMSNGKKTSSLVTSSRQSTNSQQTNKPNYNLLGLQTTFITNEGINQTHPNYSVNANQFGNNNNNNSNNTSINNSNSNNNNNNNGNSFAYPSSNASNQVNLLLNLNDETQRMNQMNSNLNELQHPQHCLIPYPQLNMQQQSNGIKSNNNNNNNITPSTQTQYPPYYLATTTASPNNNNNSNNNNNLFNEQQQQSTLSAFNEQQQSFQSASPFTGLLSNPIVTNHHPHHHHQQQQQQQQPHHPHQSTPLTVTEISFDQYSAVSQSPISSGTLTNHYTAPFAEFIHHNNNTTTTTTNNNSGDVPEFRHPFQTHYHRA